MGTNFSVIFILIYKCYMKEIGVKEAFNSSLLLHSKTIYSGLPAFHSISRPLWKTWNSSAACFPRPHHNFLNRSLLQVSGHLQPVQVCRHYPDTFWSPLASQHGQQRQQGSFTQPACGNSGSSLDQAVEPRVD